VAPLVIVAALVVAALGLGLRQYEASQPTASPDKSWLQLTYRVGAAGTTPSAADLEATMEIMLGRLGGDGTAMASGDQVFVSVPASVDLTSLEAQLQDPGRKIEFVPLPPATYGTLSASGSTPLPKAGDAIDGSLPAEADGTQIDPGHVLGTASEASPPPLPSSAAASYVLSWKISVGFTASASSSLNAWAAQHAGDYVAVVVDGKVASITSVPLQVDTTHDFAFIVGEDLNASQMQALGAILAVAELPAPVALVSVVAVAPAATRPTPTPILPGSSQGGGGLVIRDWAYELDGPAASNTVTVEVWLDYQCANCAVFDRETLPQIVTNYVSTGAVRIFFLDFDVEDSATGGHESLDAANAARCAADQGKYEAYRDLLFASQGVAGSGVFSNDRLLALGSQAGLDMATFRSCVTSGSHDAEVQADTAAAIAAGLYGVPAVSVNGKLLPTYDYPTIAQAIEAALKP
jgi:protein-disulfide isomerase